MLWIGSVIIGIVTAMLGICPLKNGGIDFVDLAILLGCIALWCMVCKKLRNIKMSIKIIELEEKLHDEKDLYESMCVMLGEE